MNSIYGYFDLLPEDVKIEMLTYLPISEIGKLCSLSTGFNKLCNSDRYDQLWLPKLYRNWDQLPTLREVKYGSLSVYQTWKMKKEEEAAVSEVVKIHALEIARRFTGGQLRSWVFLAFGDNPNARDNFETFKGWLRDYLGRDIITDNDEIDNYFPSDNQLIQYLQDAGVRLQ